MKTVVSLPNAIYREVERHAGRTRMSRSQIHAKAISEYLVRHAPDEVTKAMNVVVDRLGGTDSDTFVKRTAWRVLKDAQW